MTERIGDILVWGREHIEDNTIAQAQISASLPFVIKPIALMPDAHVGIGATIGSVIATQGAIVPSITGVDLGCGMAASLTNLTASDLPDSLDPLHSLITQHVPAGVGKGFQSSERKWGERWVADSDIILTQKERSKAVAQFGSLGSGNHFIEVCLDEQDRVWTFLHSGSRGVGNMMAQGYIKKAKDLMKRYFIDLEDPDLAYFPIRTPLFSDYMNSIEWAQRYAAANRYRMCAIVLDCLKTVVPHAEEIDQINTHHNYVAWENHRGENVMVTRKGAIRAQEGDPILIPGSMGTRSYVGVGKGNPASYNSCSHGAGRRMSRGQARKTLTSSDLTERMQGRSWNTSDAKALVDEHPDAYKDVDQVMEAQRDLVDIKHTLTAVLNYKGA